MVRPFSPNTQLSANVEFFKRIKEDALERANGEWVQHIPQGGAPSQWVFMKYQFSPTDAAIRPDFAVEGTDPMLYGLVDHFETRPEQYKGGHSGKAAKGSIFEVGGFMYRAKKVHINQWGWLDIWLVRHDNCSEPREDFCDDVANLGCQPPSDGAGEQLTVDPSTLTVGGDLCL